MKHTTILLAGPLVAAATRRPLASRVATLSTMCYLIVLGTAQLSRAQQTTPPVTDVPAQDILKIRVEEVRIPVLASDAQGRFDSTVSIDDLLVKEDGAAQKVTGVFRVPAYVLVLADTGGELNPAKTVRLTGSVATGLVSALRPDDSVALMQVNSSVELIESWSKDRVQTIEAIRTKLLPTKRSRLADGLWRAAEYLRQAPEGNRHLVIISDGHNDGGDVEMAKAMESLVASNITVHVISYTSLGRKAPGPTITRANAHSNVPEELAMSLPPMRMPGSLPDMKDIVRARAAWAIDLERLFRGASNVKEELARRELEFGKLAEETAGVAWIPTTVDELLTQGAAAARVIDSAYVVTYKPQKALDEMKAGEYRKLDVISRRVGLYVRSRRGYVAVTKR